MVSPLGTWETTNPIRPVLFFLDIRRVFVVLFSSMGQILDADAGAEGGELPDRLKVGAAGVFIAKIWELKKSRIRFLAWGWAVKMEGRGLDLNGAGRHGSIICMIMSFIMRKQG
jgi:hypothetical protein